MKKYYIISIAVLIVAAVIAIGALILHEPEVKVEVLPDVLEPIGESFVLDKTDSSITIAGLITTPVSENPVPDIDDPDYNPMEYEEQIRYVFDGIGYEIKDGKMYIEINYQKTTDLDLPSDFEITLNDEEIKNIDAAYIICNGNKEKIWIK